jgi:hypothetical protein
MTRLTIRGVKRMGHLLGRVAHIVPEKVQRQQAARHIAYRALRLTKRSVS